MEYPLSTYKVLYYRVIQSTVDKEWIDWAIEMIKAGFETESVLYLASIDLPDNQFKLLEIADRAFKELHLDFSNKEYVIKNYASYLIQLALDGGSDYLTSLAMLKDMYNATAMAGYLQDFYLLYFAKYDLIHYGDQHYWDGANQDNIDAIIFDRFTNWKA